MTVHHKLQISSVFPSTFLWRLVGFVQNLHEVFGHEVWLLEGSIISFQVLHCEKGKHVGVNQALVPGLWLFDNERRNLLTEAEKECVHTHVVHAEESMSYEVASNHDSLHSTDWWRK